MVTAKRSWDNPAKHPRKPVYGKCMLCKTIQNDLYKHIKDKHKADKEYEEELAKYL